MALHRAALPESIDNELALGNFRVLLINALAAIDNATDPAAILQYECIQTSGGYAPQAYTYTQNSSTYNADTNWQQAPDVFAQFTESGAGSGYAHTHALLWQGRGATANKLITSVNASTDQIACANHGLINGDRAFVRSTGTLPGGLAIQRYYVKAVDLDLFELYTNEALTSKVNITSAGAGTLYLQYANGVPFALQSITGTINPGTTKTIIASYQIQ